MCSTVWSVVQSYDAFLFGADLSSLREDTPGEYTVTKGGLKDIFEVLHPAFPGCTLENPVLVLPRSEYGLTAPAECRIRLATYQVEVRATLVWKHRRLSPTVFVGYLPLMVGSQFTRMARSEEKKQPYSSAEDVGGYFIVQGRERIVKQYEFRKFNCPLYQYKKKTKEHVVSVSLEHGHSIVFSSLDTVTLTYGPTLVFSLTEFWGGLTRTNVDVWKHKIWKGKIVSDEELHEWICAHVFPEFGTEDRNHEERIHYIQSEILPKLKAHQQYSHPLLEQQQEELEEWNPLPPDDWHALEHKRVVCCGDIIKQLVKLKLAFQWTAVFGKRVVDQTSTGQILSAFQNYVSNGLTKNIRSAFMTGTFSSTFTGVTQSMERSCNQLQMLSQLSRIHLPHIDKNPDLEPRMVHGTQFGYKCPFETPEGQRIGLVENLALTTQLTVMDVSVEHLMTCLKPYLSVFDTSLKVTINHRIVGYAKPNTSLEDMLHVKQSCGWPFVGVIETNDGFEFDGSKGRYIRPLKITTTTTTTTCDWVSRLPQPTAEEEEETKLCSFWCRIWIGPIVFLRYSVSQKMTVYECIENIQTFHDPEADIRLCTVTGDVDIFPGYIEWLDVKEQNARYLSGRRKGGKNQRVPYEEVHEAATVGLSASRTPFLNHNAAPRLQFAAHTSHQAIGMACVDPHTHFSTAPMHTLWYPQKPLCQVKTDETLSFTGVNALVFVMAHPFNEEDAVCVSKSFVERGGFRNQVEISYHETASVEAGEQFAFVVDVGVRLRKHDIVFTKSYLKKKNQENQNQHVRYEYEEIGRVHAVVHTVNEMNQVICHVKVVFSRVPQVGDKVHSRHGQKSIIAYISPQEDLPFTADGMTPDILLSPLAIPSRMTLGQLLESFTSTQIIQNPCHDTKTKGSTCFTYIGPSSSSTPTEETDWMKTLLSCKAEQVVYDGQTGVLLEGTVTTGFVFYQRSVHQVQDKFRAVSVAERNVETRQPIQSSETGGLRIGTEEALRFIEHGATHMLHELFTEGSDGIWILFCTSCQLGFPTNTMEEILPRCPQCLNEETSLLKLLIPYTFWTTLKKLEIVGISAHIFPTL
jgi:DNA-directed RNA polymerase subunit B